MKNKLSTLLLGIGLLGTGCSNIHNTSKIFTTDDGKTVIRTYEDIQMDHIFIQQDDSVYVHLERYLDSKSFETEYDRQIERAKIKKLVGW